MPNVLLYLQQVGACFDDLLYLVFSVFKHTGPSVHDVSHYEHHYTQQHSGKDPLRHGFGSCEQDINNNNIRL